MLKITPTPSLKYQGIKATILPTSFIIKICKVTSQEEEFTQEQEFLEYFFCYDQVFGAKIPIIADI